MINTAKLRAAADVCLSGDDEDTANALDWAADEIERLTERCAAYKGQVEAGAHEIERLRAHPLKFACPCCGAVSDVNEQLTK